MATPGALSAIPPQDLIEQIYDGAVPAKLAESLGVHKCSIYRHLADHPEYQKAKKIGMAVRLDMAEDAVITSDERTLPRAREAWRCATWRAEREHPETWGNTQKLTGADGHGPVQIEVVEYRAPATIDAVAQKLPR